LVERKTLNIKNEFKLKYLGS
jgi:hypothetical protein